MTPEEKWLRTAVTTILKNNKTEDIEHVTDLLLVMVEAYENMKTI